MTLPNEATGQRPSVDGRILSGQPAKHVTDRVEKRAWQGRAG